RERRPVQRRAGCRSLPAQRRFPSPAARAAAVSISGGPSGGLHLPRVAAEEKRVRPEEEGGGVEPTPWRMKRGSHPLAYRPLIPDGTAPPPPPPAPVLHHLLVCR
ncbi:unnamed protein product, partial [Urochloa humidicola]